jgi:hypothetical protein
MSAARVEAHVEMVKPLVRSDAWARLKISRMTCWPLLSPAQFWDRQHNSGQVEKRILLSPRACGDCVISQGRPEMFQAWGILCGTVRATSPARSDPRLFVRKRRVGSCLSSSRVPKAAQLRPFAVRHLTVRTWPSGRAHVSEFAKCAIPKVDSGVDAIARGAKSPIVTLWRVRDTIFKQHRPFGP